MQYSLNVFLLWILMETYGNQLIAFFLTKKYWVSDFLNLLFNLMMQWVWTELTFILELVEIQNVLETNKIDVMMFSNLDDWLFWWNCCYFTYLLEKNTGYASNSGSHSCTSSYMKRKTTLNFTFWIILICVPEHFHA